MNDSNQSPPRPSSPVARAAGPPPHPHAFIVPWWMLVAAFLLMGAAVAGTLHFASLAKQADLRSLETKLLEHQASHVTTGALVAYAACISERLTTIRNFSIDLAEWSKRQSQDEIALLIVSLEDAEFFRAYLKGALTETSHSLTQIKNNARPLHGAAITRHARGLSEIQDFANYFATDIQECRPGLQLPPSSQAEIG